MNMKSHFTEGIAVAFLVWSTMAMAAESGSATPLADAAKPSTEAALVWSTDYQAALKEAAAAHKPVLLDFTGSDWCIWCHRLHDEVFAQAPFETYARENLVLVEVDFPRQHPLPDKVKEQNDKLAAKFGIDGYPTVVMVDPEGTELGRTGYMEGGAKTFVRELKRFVAKSTLAESRH